MKTIGLLGGMSWESTAVYYRLLNQEVRKRRGGFHAAHILLESFDFAVMRDLQDRGDWDGVRDVLARAAENLAHSGADFWMIACNTVHDVTDPIEQASKIPFLHIADAAGQALERAGITTCGLLGTLHTMNTDFYARRLADRFGITTIVPDEAARPAIQDLILDELVAGVVSESGRKLLDEASAALADRGAGAVLLGCTELGLLFDAAETDGKPHESIAVPTFDTARLHVVAAVDRALE